MKEKQEHKTKEIYVGNGQTKTVDVIESHTNYLDLDKVREIIKKNPEKEIEVGATEDWFFTATTVNKNKIEDMDNGKYPAMLLSSCWDTFTIKINGEEQDATIKVPNSFGKHVAYASFRSGLDKIQFWIGDVMKILRCGKYELIKNFSEEVKPIVEKYIKEVETLEKYNNSKKS